MPGWEMMPQQAYGQNNWNSTVQNIKMEPMEMPMSNAYPMNNQHFFAPSTSSMQHSYPPINGGFHSGPVSPMTSNQQQLQMVGNPLTPPGYPSALPTYSQHPQSTPQTVPQSQSTPNNELPKNHNNQFILTPTSSLALPAGETPPKSPKYLPEKSIELHSNSGDEHRESVGSADEDDICKPKVNSHGKIKTHKCKQCDFTAVTKSQFWKHSIEHIKPEKVLTCVQCPFVTEYKHHMEYHMRNHTGVKPFQCTVCTYSCVNKSMLNSHLKSHSSIYQYRCSNCEYVTKYCHSLKLHLRKSGHKPDVVLDADGTPNPEPIIDVYGTRRGPKPKKVKIVDANAQQIAQELMDNHQMHIDLQQQLQQQNQHQLQVQQQQNHHQLQIQRQQNQHQPQEQQKQDQHQQLQPFIPYLPQQPQMPMEMSIENILLSKNIINMLPYLNFSNLLAAQQAQQARLLNNSNESRQLEPNTTNRFGNEEDENNEQDSNDELKGLDLSMEPPREECDSEPELNHERPKNRRKGKAFKLNLSQEDEAVEPNNDRLIPIHLQMHAGIPNTPNLPNNSTSQSESTSQEAQHQEKKQLVSSTTDQPHQYECKWCGIAFKDMVLHSIHMGYHGFNDVFQCNMCGVQCKDHLEFFLHIARNSHHL